MGLVAIAVYSTQGGVRGWLAGQTLEGSFSSVSKPIFASKYSFFCIFRDLQDFHTFAPFQTQILQIFAPFRKILWIFAKFLEFLLNFAIFRRKFHRILSELRQILYNYQNFMYFAEKMRKSYEILQKIANFDRNLGGWQAVRENDPPPPRVVNKSLNSPVLVSPH